MLLEEKKQQKKMCLFWGGGRGFRQASWKFFSLGIFLVVFYLETNIFNMSKIFHKAKVPRFNQLELALLECSLKIGRESTAQTRLTTHILHEALLAGRGGGRWREAFLEQRMFFERSPSPN